MVFTLYKYLLLVVLTIFIEKKYGIFTMLLTEQILNQIILEELTKGEVNNLIASKLEANLNSREFKKKVKELAADVVSEIYKILWQRNSFWKSASTGN